MTMSGCHSPCSVLQLYRLLIFTLLANLTVWNAHGYAKEHSSSRDGGGGSLRAYGSRSVDMRVEFEVEEGVAVGTLVGGIPIKPGFTYRFNENLEEFVLNSTSGEIRTKKLIDRESLVTDHFDVVILSSQPTYPIEVRIFIKDINDCAPTFPEPEVAVSFPESAISGTRVFLDTAEDKDSAPNGVHTDYKIVEGNEDGHFRLVVTTNPSGEAPFLHLETTARLDRETRPFYRLNISAQDGGSPPKLGYLIVNVSINDVNDFQPVFAQSQYYVSLNESVPVGTQVLQVLATDNDIGVNAKISYYLSETEEQFSIDSETGIITTAQALDCPKNCQSGQKSCPKSCVFTVFARDHGTPRQDGRAYVTVTLVESNHPPLIKFRYFPPTASNANVLETAQNGSVVAAISVVDLDEGLNGETFVEIVSGNELKHFTIESTPSFQLVRTNGVLDREKIALYNLTITVRDNGSPPCSSTAFLIIEVNDNKDPEISFAKTEYSAVLRENVPIGTYVASITATDENTRTKSQVIYSIVSGNEKLWFYIEPSSGLLTTRAPLDREQQGIVRLKISARDGGPYPKWAHAQIKITILDENDESPQFTNYRTEASLPEDAPPGSVITTMTAVDHDQGTNGTITYSLAAYTDLAYPGHFHIDPNSGKLTTRVRLDHESMTKYDIQVIAKDQGSPPLSSTAMVHLSVKDVNDNIPKFYPLEYFISISEESPVGTSIGRVIAQDPDVGINGDIKFKLVSSSNNKFSVDESTGDIKVRESVRNSRVKVFQLQISATDGGGKTSDDNAMVEIVLESFDSSSLAFSKDKYSFTIGEDNGKSSSPQEINRIVGQVDVKNHKLSLGDIKLTIISGDPNGVFTIEKETGYVKATKGVDREEKSSYSLDVLARKGSMHGSCTVTILITDLNDQPPQWNFENLDVLLPKDSPVGESIAVIKATDLDEGNNAKINYTLAVNPNNLFSIHTSTGLITLTKSIRKMNNIRDLTLEVVATDNGQPPLSSRRAVYVKVQEVNLHSPVFDHFAYETSLSESTSVNTRFFLLKAVDKDVGVNAEVNYEIVSGNEERKFGIFPDGNLFVKSHLDREKKDYYSLTIVAKDNGVPSRSSVASLVVHVIDENDVTPKFINSTFSFYIAENEPIGTYVGKVVALDGDVGRNAELTYRFSSPQNDFSLDAKNGFIKTLRVFDRETLVQRLGQPHVALDVVVHDNGPVRLKDKAQVIIHFTDENDESPTFTKSQYVSQISEDSPVGSPVIKVSATDLDEGLNGDLFYYLSEGNEKEHFQIDSATGLISIAKELDREVQDQFTLTVIAQDNGEKFSLSSAASVTVEVLDANDCAPQFNESFLSLLNDDDGEEGLLLSHSSIRVIETTPVNTKLVQLKATDSDLGLNGQILYSITGGNRHDTFKISSTSGILYLNKPLDYEKYTKYTLSLTASDSGNPKLSTSIEFHVNVDDFNDNPPQFPTTSIVRQIQEGIPLKSPIVTVTADDPDSGKNGKVKYSIRNQEPPGSHFGIDPDNGIIHTLMPIDREVTDTFRLTIVAEDQASPESQRLSSEKLVTVIVEDVNDCEPRFTCFNAALLRQNSESSTEIIKINAIDLDSESNGMVTYDLLTGDSSLFELDRITGSLTLKRSVTNPQPRYQLTIRATDEAIQSQRKSSEFYLMVLGVSEESSVNGLSFENPRYKGSIYENEPVASSILTVTATLDQPQDNYNIEYYITNITSSDGKLQNRLFDIDVKRGSLSTAAILDREMNAWDFHIEVHAILVSARGLYTASTMVDVEVLDKNDTPPSWPSKVQKLSISENAPVGQQIATLTATDEDTKGTIAYSIVTGNDSKFELDSVTGVLKIIDTLDREEEEEWTLTVRADDGVQSSDTQVSIMVTDTNDNPPLWSAPTYSFDIPEDTSPEHAVGTLKATDRDKDLNGHVTYSILSDWGDDVFSLNPETGIFTLTNTLDYESVQHYIFVVQAQDMGVPSLSSTTTVYLNVVDLNDNAPTFDSVSYTAEIPEDVPIGHLVLSVRATDLDSGLNGLVSYSITSGNDEDAFSISENGTIFTVKDLDREKKSSYQLQVEAKDQSDVKPLSSSVQVTITIKDVNDMYPEFISSNTTTVAENTPLNSVLLIVKAIDKDEGRNGYVEYILHNEKSTFSLGMVDGILRVTGNIDREKSNNFTLKITARDRGEPPKSKTEYLFVKIRDKNDHGPVFDSKQYSAAIPENSSVGMNVLQVSATDKDEGMNSQIRYSIVAGDPNRDFVIGDDSGILRLARGLNYERKKVYSITVQAEDLGEDRHYDTAVISITVLDVNDRAPTFLDSPYLAYVRENLETVPTTVLYVNAYDADSTSKNLQVRYLLKDGDKDSFRVNATTGEITVHRVLDRERQSEYHLTVVAMDTGTPRLTGTGMVQVLVSDDNDCDPIFDQDRYDLFVEENSPTGSLVSTLSAVDLDDGLNSKIRYYIQGAQSLPFEINELTGEIVTKGELDREVREEYKFNVKAVDSSPIFKRSSETEVTITLKDQNDNFPKFKHSSYSVKVADNVVAGGYILGVCAMDADSGLNGRVRYYLGGADADKFQINDATGVIKAIPALLKSSKTQFSLDVRAVDSSPKEPLSSSVPVKVELVNADRFPTIKSEAQEFSFMENVSNTVITTLEALPAKSSDRRSRRFIYFIGGGNLGNSFTVDKNSGKLSVSPSGLDYESATEYELWIEASDQDEPDLRAAIPLYIKVKDVNDNEPIFETKIYNVSIPEEEPGHKLVTTVLATDKDSGVNGEIRYMMSEETIKKYGKLFEIKRETGEIFTKVKLDREEQSHYVLEVEASDLGDPPKTGTATVMINVLDINDNPMKFTRLFSVNVTENAPIGTFVIQVTSVDKDIGENANCSYSFTDNASGKFAIDPYSGNVTVSGLLDREAQDEYLLKVSAVDGSWRAETLLTVTLEDVNDMAPQFEQPSYDFNIPESDQPVSFVGQVIATDKDKRGPNSLVTYGLKQQSDIFSVDPVSGEIFSKKPLKYKNSLRKFSPENEHNLVITAVDSGKPPMSSECSITISVVNANNHAPVFEQKSYFSTVLFNMTLGTKLLQVSAIDLNDFGVNSELEYLVIGGNGSELFTIQKETGWIVLSGDVTDKLSKTYTLQIRATDRGIPPLYDDTTVVMVVTGMNIHSPVFSSLSYRVIVPENEAVETVIVSVSASDQDKGPNGQLRYNISRGNEKGRFAINPLTGAVVINKSLDYDTKKEYRLIISTTDLGYEPRSSEAELTVILTDVNDNPPYFEKTVYKAYIKENAPINSPVFTLTAKDKDSPKNGVIRYAIVGGSGKHAFVVDPSSGLVSSNKVFDYEDRQDYQLDILASNPDTNLHGATKLEINIKGVNEFIPKFVQSVFHFTVSESAPIGSQIGSVQATDEDNGDDGIVYYLLVGSSNDRGFLINTNTGAITISRRLDRESQSRVVLTVLAKNSGSIKGNDTDEAQIVISVQDGNDPPVFEKEIYKADISEDAPIGSLVVSVKANDIDVRPSNNRFTYEILDGNPNKTFKIDPITGYISTAGYLDREKISIYNLKVGAVDTGLPPQTGITVVMINLLDVNDSPPMLKNSSLEGRVPENEPPNTRVMTLKAVDMDISPNAEPFKFNLVGGNDASKFRIDTKNGHIYSTASFDRETTPELNIIVEISDNGTPTLKSRQEVKILVQDKNDSPSQPRNGTVLVYMFKNKLPRTKIATVEPIDKDEVGQYTCRLESSQDVFKIPTNCDLLLTRIPTNRRQILQVSADDGRHAEVKSVMQTEFNFIDNSTIKNSVVIRAFSTNSAKLLEKSYNNLVTFFKSIFTYEPQVYSFISKDNDTDIIVAIYTGSEYLGVDEVSSVLLTHKGKIESIVEASVAINYSICTSQSVCQNGASCKQSLNSFPSQAVVSSPLLILSSPSVQLEYVCQCPSSFTGANCQLRREPCQPNPCGSGGTCIKQGFNFTCICPPDKQGKLCEMERSSACESNPCQNGGSCQENQQAGSYFCLCRPGFYGNLCQTASNACKPNPCLNGGECFNPVGSSSAFPRCKCRTHYYGRYCEKSAFGFSFGSYMSFPSLDPNTNDIAIIFSTNKKNSLLVYDFGEQTGGRSDFVALQLINGKTTFSYGGARTAISSISVNKTVTDGQWYRIIATRNSRVVSLTVSMCKDSGESCDDCKPGDSTCYVSDIGISGTLSFNGHPVLIGGVRDVESILERPGQIQTDDFVGCIHSVVVNGRHLNMSTPLESRAISDQCQRVEDVCELSTYQVKNKCGYQGQCIDMWDSYICRCDGLISPNCHESFTPYSFSSGSYVEFRAGDKYKRSQLLHDVYSDYEHQRKRREISSKSISLSFRTIQQDGIIFYAASGKDFTLIELDNGELKFSFRVGFNQPISMRISGASVTDGAWHVLKLVSQNRGLNCYIDGQKMGEELDASSAHDFLDPYLTVLALGGFSEAYIPSNKIYAGFTGCMTNFTINNELQPLNGSGSIFDEVNFHGKLVRGCSNAIAGAATAPDPLSIGVTLVIVFFVFLLVAISVSFAVFRLRKREKNSLQSVNSASKPSPQTQGPGDVVRSHILDGEAEALRNFVRNSKKISGSNTCYQKPDIIERTTSTPPHNSSSNSPTNNALMNSPNGISMDPELPDLPEHYDLENASSIAPSDIDIVYHYKGFRENISARKSSPFRHTHHFPGNLQSSGIRQSPISNVLKSTPLARLSPSSELSQQTAPRILTLQDISGKPLQSALLATNQKDPMSQSERSLNISQSSSRSSMIHASSQGTKKKRRKCGGESGNTMTIGLTAEEIERLNNSRHKNNSSLISTLDAVSSSESDDRRKNNLSNLLESKPERRTHSRNTSSEEDESGNDSFSCSEFEYDNDKRDFRQPHSHMMFSKHAHPDGAPEGEESFRGSLSTLVASDDDLSYINSYAKSPNHLPGGPSSIGWDYLLNWGPNFDNLAGVFKDIAQLPDSNNTPHSHNVPSSSNLPTNLGNLGNSSSSSANRNSRYPTPRPSEEYV